MNPEKQQYLKTIRANTAYPTYRAIIGVIAILGYLLAAVTALGALIGGLSTLESSFMEGLGILIAGAILSGLIYLGVRFWKEACLIIADIGDSITDSNSRTSH
jgi:hypothetical protein